MQIRQKDLEAIEKGSVRTLVELGHGKNHDVSSSCAIGFPLKQMVIAVCPAPLPEPLSPVPCLSLHWQGVTCPKSCWGTILWGYTIISVERKIRQKAWKLHSACLKRVYSAQLHLQFPSWSLEADELHRDSGLSCFGPEIWEENSQIRLSRRGEC